MRCGNLPRRPERCVRIYRLKNLFGKWCRPNYNSVTATFCHNIANDLPIAVSDPAREVELSYVDDVVAAFLAEIDGRQARRGGRGDIQRTGFGSAIWPAESRRFMRCGTR